MNKCLITKLAGSVDNNSLLKIGELRIKVSKIDNPSEKTQGFNLIFKEKVTATILGDGYFTDKTLSENNGKTMEISAQTSKNIFVSNGDYEISIDSKYSLRTLKIKSDSVSGVYSSDVKNRSLNLDDLKFCNITEELDIFSPNVHGNLSSLTNMSNLSFVNIQSNNIYGDYSSLEGLKKLAFPLFTGNNMKGNTSSISKLDGLVNGTFQNLEGDISKLSSLKNLKTLWLPTSKVNGDLATLPAPFYFISTEGDVSFTWGTRPSTSSIIAITGGPRIDNVDKMLQDQAQCASTAPSGNVQHKTISVKGTRTSASDTALSTLQGKGYTVIVTPV